MGLVLSKTGADAQAQPGKLGKLMNMAFPAMNIYFSAQEMADGRSLGAVGAENLGFLAGNMLANAALSKYKFRGKGILGGLAGMAAGMVISPTLGDWADKYAPIYRFKPKKKVESSDAINDKQMAMQMPQQITN